MGSSQSRQLSRGAGTHRDEMQHRCSVLVALTVWAVLLSVEDGSALALRDSVEAASLEEITAFVDVTPQVPDGPVVQQFNKQVAKKKMANEIEKQKVSLGPELDASDAKRKAKEQEMEMMAEVVIKGRVAKKEQELKKSEKEKRAEEKARKKIAQARRTERYVKLNQDKVQREQERLRKLHTHTQNAFGIIKKLFRRKQSTKKSAMVAMAKAQAEKNAALTVGGYLDLKGNQINMPTLVNLNSKITEAMKDPSSLNIDFAQKAFKRAALAVSQEVSVSEEKEAGWKAEERKNQEIVEKREQKIQSEKLEKLAAKVTKEKNAKANRGNEIQEKEATNEANEKKKWVDAVATVKKQRQMVVDNEMKAKKKFVDGIAAKEKAKKAAAPGELVIAKKKKFEERSEKYDNSAGTGEAARHTAKIEKKRACEEFKGAENALEAAGQKVADESKTKQKEAMDTKFCSQ